MVKFIQFLDLFYHIKYDLDDPSIFIIHNQLNFILMDHFLLLIDSLNIEYNGYNSFYLLFII
jgi:hypothetical protein